MIIIQSGRQNGKTSFLIEQAHATGAGIVVANLCMKRYVEDMALKMNMKDVEVYTCEEIVNKVTVKMDKFYIDELEMVLSHLLNHKVEIATGSIECFPIKGVSR